MDEITVISDFYTWFLFKYLKKSNIRVWYTQCMYLPQEYNVLQEHNAFQDNPHFINSVILGTYCTALFQIW